MPQDAAPWRIAGAVEPWLPDASAIPVPWLRSSSPAVLFCKAEAVHDSSAWLSRRRPRPAFARTCPRTTRLRLAQGTVRCLRKQALLPGQSGRSSVDLRLRGAREFFVVAWGRANEQMIYR